MPKVLADVVGSERYYSFDRRGMASWFVLTLAAVALWGLWGFLAKVASDYLNHLRMPQPEEEGHVAAHWDNDDGLTPGPKFKMFTPTCMVLSLLRVDCGHCHVGAWWLEET